MSDIDQQFIEFVVKSLVSKPDAVQIARRIDEKGVLLELTVDPEDLGRVIGKRGATAQSLRTLLRALGTKNDARYNLKIIDNGVAPPPRDSAPAPTPAADDSDAVAEPEEVITGEEGDVGEAEVEKQEETATPSAEQVADDAHDDVVSKTRKELEDLDDLDV
ncbi:MAG TPA: KH domain-containing protein [Candidatus Saccharimonadales bacterium]|nr:KH domain-containing protein [Candidatus Saccharimonadales bacterium]